MADENRKFQFESELTEEERIERSESIADHLDELKRNDEARRVATNRKRAKKNAEYRARKERMRKRNSGPSADVYPSFTGRTAAAIKRLLGFGSAAPLNQENEKPEPLSYHDVYVTTEALGRRRMSDMPFGFELVCNRVGGWTLSLQGKIIAGEYEGAYLEIEVGGYCILERKENDGH